MSDTTRIARQLAGTYPDARLLCPVCGAMLSGVNFDRHLGRHTDPTVQDGPWPGIGLRRGQLWTADSGVFLRGIAGLRHRAVHPATAVTAGPVVAWRPDPVMTAYADEGTVRGADQRVGIYLRVSGGGRAITVRCRSAGQFRKVWTGWEPGRPMRRWNITLGTPGFVGLQYALAEFGLLQLRDVSPVDP